ncbi:MAG: PepSY domain-containing protein [Caulobacteraceae bacterium]
MRLLIILHRYLGAAAGLLMALWCLSGFVMMYQSYPSLDPGDRLKGLEPLRLTAVHAAAAAVPDDAAVRGFRVEMTAGRPVLEVQRGPRRREAIDLAAGAPFQAVPAGEALRIAETYAVAHGVTGQPQVLGLVAVDQWTLDGINRDGPLYHFAFGDPARTELYVSRTTGHVAQETTRRTRVLAWLGAIPHWLYPTVLRQDPRVWSDVVVWTSIVGTFLTVIGLYIGVMKFRRYKSGRWSPYRGWFYWHHITGLVFGVLTLTWVMSGLFTMNPFGFLDSDVGQSERPALAGTFSGAEMKRFLAKSPGLATGDLAALEAAPLGGRLFVMATDRQGRSARLDADGRSAPLTALEAAAALRGLPGHRLAGLDRLDHEDAYYYSGFDRKAVFPVYRARFEDGAAFYLDGRTGKLVEALDDTRRQSRWLRTGLHDFDFFAGLRARPVWDLVVILLLAGVTVVCATGAWLGIKRIGRDARAAWAAAKRLAGAKGA